MDRFDVVMGSFESLGIIVKDSGRAVSSLLGNDKWCKYFPFYVISLS